MQLHGGLGGESPFMERSSPYISRILRFSFCEVNATLLLHSLRRTGGTHKRQFQSLRFSEALQCWWRARGPNSGSHNTGAVSVRLPGQLLACCLRGATLSELARLKEIFGWCFYFGAGR